MNEINVDQLLLQMRTMAEKAQGLNVSVPATGEKSDFSKLLKSTIDKVNDMQMEAGDMAKRFDAGDETIALSDVMINLQSASVSFQAMLQVRNRLVSAYQDIMNMSI